MLAIKKDYEIKFYNTSQTLDLTLRSKLVHSHLPLQLFCKSNKYYQQKLEIAKYTYVYLKYERMISLIFSIFTLVFLK